MRAATASTRHVEQADHGAFGLVPDRNHLGRRQQLHLAAVALEIGGRLLRQHNRAVLARAEEEPRRPLLVDVLGLGQRDGVRGAIHRLGQLLLALLDLTAEPDDHVVGEDRSVDGDRAELSPVDPGRHGALTTLTAPRRPRPGRPAVSARTPQNRPREASHGTRATEFRGGHPGRWSVLMGAGSAKPTYTFQRQAIAVTPSVLSVGLRTGWSGEVVQLVALE